MLFPVLIKVCFINVIEKRIENLYNFLSFLVLRDPNPNWRKLVWSSSGNLLICSRSLPILDVFDVRNYCYSVPIVIALYFFLKTVHVYSSILP